LGVGFDSQAQGKRDRGRSTRREGGGSLLGGPTEDCELETKKIEALGYKPLTGWEKKKKRNIVECDGKWLNNDRERQAEKTSGGGYCRPFRGG